ncbi:plasmid partitioning protein RepB [Pararhizobium sp. O133]|uniref:plasmid partitioning protein RepB n=1 Tax=Pararhizobium sp. O133 TaxID=3449278 RepID=UPI003F68515A
MARKNLLAGLMDQDDSTDTPAYPMRGASKTMIRSIDELAKQAEKLMEGETVVEIDPDTIDGSFVTDRMDDDSEQFQDLLRAMQERGQDSPVLVRPHPQTDGRYQIVFGHRRVRAARQLGRPVRAVIKALDDRTHVIAQGQENSARANLTFIERAAFAKRLDDLGYDRETIMSALSANAASVSKMMSVTERIPAELIEQIGSATAIGRERWLELSLVIGKQGNLAKARNILSEPVTLRLDSSARFNTLLTGLKTTAKRVTKSVAAGSTWAPVDKSVSAQIKSDSTGFSLSLKARNAVKFGEFLADNLDELYERFSREDKD